MRITSHAHVASGEKSCSTTSSLETLESEARYLSCQNCRRAAVVKVQINKLTAALLHRRKSWKAFNLSIKAMTFKTTVTSDLLCGAETASLS